MNYATIDFRCCLQRKHNNCLDYISLLSRVGQNSSVFLLSRRCLVCGENAELFFWLGVNWEGIVSTCLRLYGTNLTANIRGRIEISSAPVSWFLKKKLQKLYKKLANNSEQAVTKWHWAKMLSIWRNKFLNKDYPRITNFYLNIVVVCDSHCYKFQQRKKLTCQNTKNDLFEGFGHQTKMKKKRNIKSCDSLQETSYLCTNDMMNKNNHIAPFRLRLVVAPK